MGVNPTDYIFIKDGKLGATRTNHSLESFNKKIPNQFLDRIKDFASEDNFTFNISYLDAFSKKLNQFISNVDTTISKEKISEIKENISRYDECISKIEQRFPDTFIINNIKNIEQHFKNIHNCIDNNINIQQITEISPSITTIIEILHEFITLGDELKKYQIQIFQIFGKGIEILKKIYTEEHQSPIASATVSTLLIDQNNDIFLAVNTEEKSNKKDQIKQMISDVYNQCKLFKNRIIESSDNFCIQHYLLTEINVFLSDLRYLIINIDDNLSDEKANSLLENYSTELNNFIKELDKKSISKLSSSDEFFSFLFKISKSQQKFKISDIFYSIESIEKIYEKYLVKSIINDCYSQFIYYYYKNNNLSNQSNQTLIEKVTNIFKEIQKNEKKYYYIGLLAHILIGNLLDQNMFKSDFQETQDFIKIQPAVQFGQVGVSFDLNYNSDMNFFLEKSYEYIKQEDNKDQNKERIEREKTIFQKKLSKFIVYAILNNDYDEINNDNSYQQLYIPYFPNGTIHSLICQPKNYGKIELTFVDKIVILLEIATALNDLHSNELYHGNISDSVVYINSQLDAYIGSFYSANKNVSLEDDFIYYRSPDYFSKTDKSLSDQKLCDIYSFGVLAHEIFTEITPKSIMKKYSNEVNNNYKDRKTIEDIIKDNFNEILLSDENIKCLCEKDIPQKNINGMREIIKKCIEKDPQKRYESINEIINEIKQLEIYKQNSEEIEFRFNNSVDCRTYQCGFSDIVESYNRGQTKCFENMTEFITTYIKFNANSNEEFSTDSLNDMILSIYDVFNIQNKPFNKYFTRIIDYAQNHEYQNVIENFRLLIRIYNIHQSILTKTFNNFIEFYNEHIPNRVHKISNNEIGDFFDEIQKNGDFYYIDFFFQFLIKNIFDEEIFARKTQEILFDNNLSFNEIRSMDFNNALGVTYNKNLNFFLKKVYSEVDRSTIEAEKSIFNNNDYNYVPHIEKEEGNEIYLPYFPIGILQNTIKFSSQRFCSSQRIVKLNNVDKIIIFLEICESLKELNNNGQYHGSLSDESIYIDSKKDAYIGSFLYKADKSHDTKKSNAFYTRPPEFFDNNYDNINNLNEDDLFKKKKMEDIFSLGVIMHELFSDTTPAFRFDKENAPSKTRTDILKGDYFQYLFSGDHNECFKEGFVDFLGNSLKGVKDIIKKCMERNPDERFDSNEKIIESIKGLSLYLKNKEEIEFRLANFTKISDYHCTISDIFEGYCRGQGSCLKDLVCLLKIIKGKREDSYVFTDNIIENIYFTFKISIIAESNPSDSFVEIFNQIIHKTVDEEIDHTKTINLSSELLNLSLKENVRFSSSSTVDFIVPISTLKIFIQNNTKIMDDLFLTWIYIIAKEISIIHSNNLFHGELSTDMIGVYYNQETKTFVPSAILFYSFAKREINYQPQKKKKKSKNNFLMNYQSEYEIINKNQKRDIKRFIEIVCEIKEYDGIKSNEEIQEKINEILRLENESKTINVFLFKLYNYAIDNITISKEENIFNHNTKFENYSSLQITFPSLIEILRTNEINMNDSFIKIDKHCDRIINFLDHSLECPTNKIIDNFHRQPAKKSEFGKNEDIDEIMVLFNHRSREILDIITNEKNIQQITYDSNDKSNEPDSLYVEPFTLFDNVSRKKSYQINKANDLSTKPVYRNLEFAYLSRRALDFILFRYIKCLNPTFRYKITIRLDGTNFDFKQGSFDPQKEIKRITDLIPRIKTEPIYEKKKNVVIFVEKE